MEQNIQSAVAILTAGLIFQKFVRDGINEKHQRHLGIDKKRIMYPANVAGIEDNISHLSKFCITILGQYCNLCTDRFGNSAGSNNLLSRSGIGNCDNKILWREQTGLYPHQKRISHYTGSKSHLNEPHVKFAGGQTGTAKTKNENFIGMMDSSYKALL